MMIMLLIAWLPWLLLGAGALYLGLRLVRAVERRSSATGELAVLRERLQLLEDAVTEQGEELRRVADGQQFTQRLLAERSAGTSGGTSAGDVPDASPTAPVQP
jgi:hypothetical protein